MTRSEEKIDTGQHSPEAYAKMHQKAFRVAFNFLTSHFPPGQGDEWWEQAAKDVTDAWASAGCDKLAENLLAGVYNYLNDECKRREEQNAES